MRPRWLVFAGLCAAVTSCDLIYGIQDPYGHLLDATTPDTYVPPGALEAAPSTDGTTFPDGTMSDASADVDAAADAAPDTVDASPPLDPHRVVQISANGATACALTLDGFVYCWGSNNCGQVGDGTRVDRSAAVPVAKDSTDASFGNIVEIGVGFLHVCARDLYRYYYCWGDDDLGQLGDGRYNLDGGVGPNNGGLVVSTNPIKLAIQGVQPVQIAVGKLHSCVVDDPHLDAGLSVECWGSNLYGELGHDAGTSGDVWYGGVFAAHPTPIEVPLAPDLEGMTLGYNMGCYLRTSSNGVWCWGLNDSYQLLGVATGNLGSSSLPIAVPGPGNVGTLGYQAGLRQVAAHSGSHACVRDEATMGNVWCWGENDYGALGTGAPIGAISQVVEVPITSVNDVRVGPDETCAIVGTAANIACWGSNANGQLGHGNELDPTCGSSQTACNANPIFVQASDAGVPIRGVTQITLGESFVCALKDDGTVWCWGEGANGRLGGGDTNDSPFPVKVVGLP
jgi:alpha-tubulin suppressor-like RCC1 family protein